MKKILYIEDEPFLAKIVNDSLTQQGFQVLLVSDGARVMHELESFMPDLCVLDIMLPHVDGYTLCQQIRRLHPWIPIIFLTARTETADLVKGFEAGGTDYIRKPFTLEELVVRIENQLKLANGTGNLINKHTDRIIGKYHFFPSRFELLGPNGCIKLSHREQEVLNLLVSNINQVVDRKQILQSIWGDDSFFNSRTLDVYIRKLRKHLHADPDLEIITLKGRGYLFLERS